MISKPLLHRQVTWLTWLYQKKRPGFRTGASFQREKLDRSEVRRHTEASLEIMIIWSNWKIVLLFSTHLCYFNFDRFSSPLLNACSPLLMFVHLCSMFVHLWLRSRWSDIPPSPCSARIPMKGSLRGRRGSANASSSSGKIGILWIRPF